MAKPVSATFYSWDKLPEERLNELLSRKIITGERTMLAHIYLKKGCVVPKHHHENEQFTYVLDGALKFFLGEDGKQEVTVRTGEVLHLPSNLPHAAQALEDTLDFDVFTPPRADWLNKTDDYLRKK
jgi:quercetin dioxygenase-like cupin family protein